MNELDDEYSKLKEISTLLLKGIMDELKKDTPNYKLVDTLISQKSAVDRDKQKINTAKSKWNTMRSLKK
jgi:hypothetical protein